MQEHLNRLAEGSMDLFVCPVTHAIMRRPAYLAGSDEHRFEQSVLHDWVQVKGNDTNPLTGETVADLAIVEDKFLARTVRNWCEKQAVKLQRANEAAVAESEAAAHTACAAGGVKVHVFVDDSNIAIGAMEQGRAVQVPALARALHRGRHVVAKHVAGSGPGKAAHWAQWRREGYAVHEEARHGKEAFVDDVLGAQIAAALSRRWPDGGTRVLVLATGDGNDNHGRASFPDHVQSALLQEGWHVELYTWRRSTSATYHRFAREYGRTGRFKIHYLDEFRLC